MMRKKSQQYIQIFAVAMIASASPARGGRGDIYQNGDVQFFGTAVKQACITEIRHQNQVSLEYTIELYECPWQDANVLRVIVSTSKNVGRIPLFIPDNTVIYSESRIPDHYSLSFPRLVIDPKETSVITVYYP